MKSYRQQAALLKLLAHPLRLQILDILREGDECVCHLSAALGKPQPYVSQQLAVLRSGGAVADYREGTNIFYRLADDNVRRQVEAACGPADGGQQTAAGHRVVAGCHCPKCAEIESNRG
ncbi:MAG: metalloregulator ArsR/SmtB family transcription factor [Anaerolineae bacterium]|nr:metalloregulator ArsR/SmtB family transcription factor [Anaerolineae bacterium]